MGWFFYVYYHPRIYNQENVIFSIKKIRKKQFVFGLIYVTIKS